MVAINFAKRDVNLKLVYYGPCFSGKTTNLAFVHRDAPAAKKGELTTVATEGDRTIFFDYAPLGPWRVGGPKGLPVRVQLYTVPGEVFYNATRKLVLQGADGVVFVADSHRLAANLELLQNLEDNLKEQGLDIQKVPIVFQWNKRDLPDAVPVEELEKKVNRLGAPSVSAVATTGEGVIETFEKATQIALDKLCAEYGAKAESIRVADPDPERAKGKRAGHEVGDERGRAGDRLVRAGFSHEVGDERGRAGDQLAFESLEAEFGVKADPERARGRRFSPFPISKHERYLSITYYGPSFSGKTANLAFLHGEAAPAAKRGELTSVPAEAGSPTRGRGHRKLFFNYGPVYPFSRDDRVAVHFAVCAVPGHDQPRATRSLGVQLTSGVVFVADSAPDKMGANLESLQNLEDDLKEQGIDIRKVPLVIQWNKRDLPDALPIEVLEEKINRLGVPTVNAVALSGEGVLQTFEKIARMALETIRGVYGHPEEPPDVFRVRGVATDPGATLAPTRRQVGPYRLVSLLGRGGFSEVWRAWCVDPKRPAHYVALKVLVHPAHLEQLRAEANALAIVRGKGIVSILELGLDADPPYIALELLPGGNLRSRMPRAGLPLGPVPAITIFEQVLECLAEVHSEGIVHGDLKPENVLFTGNEGIGKDQLKLADFGLSRRIAQKNATLSLSLSLDDARFAGTIDYMAPEQRQGEKPTLRTDVYAAGVLLYELLVGERPQGVFTMPSEKNPALPPIIDRVVACSLAPDPRHRFADARAMLGFLRSGLTSDWKPLAGAHARLTRLIEASAAGQASEAWTTRASIAISLLASSVALFSLSQVGAGPPLDVKRLAVAGALVLVATDRLAAALRPWLEGRRRALVSLKKAIETQIHTGREWSRLAERRAPGLPEPEKRRDGR